MKRILFLILSIFLLSACALQDNLNEAKNKAVDTADQAKADLMEIKNNVEDKTNEVNDKINKINDAGKAIGDVFDDDQEQTEETVQ